MLRSARTRTVVVTIAWSLLLLSGASTFVDFDCWHLMALAREAIALGHLPLADPFAYTPTLHPVVQHEWGSGFVLYMLATHGGVVAFQVARLLLVSAEVVLCIGVARARGATVGVLAALAPLAIVMAWIGLTAIRPQVFTVTLLALWLSFIEADRRGRRSWMAIAVPAYVAWLNLHAGFVVGWGFLVLHGIEQAWRRRPFVHVAVLAAVCVALVAVNPYGLDYYSYLVRALTMDRPLIGEWRPIWQAHPVAMAVYGCSVVVAIGAIAQVGLRDATGWPILAAAAYLAARHERHVSMYALVWFAYVPAFVARTSAGRLLDRAWNRPVRAPLRAATGVLVVAVAVSFALRRPWQLTVPGAMQTAAPVPYPVGPVAYLDAHDVRGNLFTPFVVGAYVSWKLHPRVKVSLDSRYEVAYPPDALERNLQFYDGSADWRAILERDPTDLVLVPRTAPVAGELATQATWTRVYEDDAYVLFAKDHVGLPVENRRGTGLIGRLP